MGYLSFVVSFKNVFLGSTCIMTVFCVFFVLCAAFGVINDER